MLHSNKLMRCVTKVYSNYNSNAYFEHKYVTRKKSNEIIDKTVPINVTISASGHVTLPGLRSYAWKWRGRIGGSLTSS